MIGKTTYLYNICSFPRYPAAVMTIIASVKKVFIISNNLLVQWWDDNKNDKDNGDGDDDDSDYDNDSCAVGSEHLFRGQ